MAAIDDLNAKITEIGGKVTKLGTDVANLLAGSTPTSAVAAAVTNLSSISSQLDTIDATLNPPAPAPAPAPTPTA